MTTTSSGYASGGDVGCYQFRMNDDDFEKADWRRHHEHVSRGSHRYRRRASINPGTDRTFHRPPSPPEQPPAPVLDDGKDDGIPLPVYANLVSEQPAIRRDAMADPTQCHPSLGEHLDNRYAHPQLAETGNGFAVDYLLPTERSELATDSATLRRTGNRSSPVYVNGNLLITSLNQTWRKVDAAGRSRSRSLSSSRDRTLTNDQSTTYQFGGVQQRLSFSTLTTSSLASRSPSPPHPAEDDADWDDRLSTLSLGHRRRFPALSPPDRRQPAQPRGPPHHRSRSAKRRLLFGGNSTTSIDRRLEAVEEGVRPLFKQIGPASTISNVDNHDPPAANRPTGLFPRLGETEESIYETIADVSRLSGRATTRGREPEVIRPEVKGPKDARPKVAVPKIGVPEVEGPEMGDKHAYHNSRHPTIRQAPEVKRPEVIEPEVDDEHVYHNIDEFLVACPSDVASTSIHDIPPPVPPPPLPVRRSTAMPLCRSDVIELDSNHVYTIADVLDSFEALAAHLPRAQRFIHDLQTAAYLRQRRQTPSEVPGDAEGRWNAAVALSRGGSEKKKTSTWCGGAGRPRRRTHAAMYSVDDSQPVIIEDYVCSPGNLLNSERPRRRPGESAAVSVATHKDGGLYVPMKPGSPASRRFAAFDGRAGVDDVARKANRTTRKNKERDAASRSIVELNRGGDDDPRACRSSKLFQIPPSSSRPPDARLMADVARHRKALSRSLMDGISHKPAAAAARPTSGVVADRKQNSRMSASTCAVDLATGRSVALPDYAPRVQGVLRSVSEDRQTGTGNSSKVGSPPPDVADRRRTTDKPLDRSRTSSILQWTAAASGSGREIFC